MYVEVLLEVGVAVVLLEVDEDVEMVLEVDEVAVLVDVDVDVEVLVGVGVGVVLAVPSRSALNFGLNAAVQGMGVNHMEYGKVAVTVSGCGWV